MLVKEVMSADVVTVSPDETLRALIEKFLKFNFHTLPVIDDEKNVVGVINFEDIMKIFVPHDPALEKLLKSIHFYNNIEEEDILEAELPEALGEKIKVGDIMTTDVVTVDEEATIAEARGLMKVRSTERIPVVKEGKLVGFITLFDIILGLLKKRKIIK